MIDTTNELSDYWLRPAGVSAVEVDKHWLQWLTKEKGYTKVNLGDYFVKGNDGEQVMPKERFERLFFKHE